MSQLSPVCRSMECTTLGDFELRSEGNYWEVIQCTAVNLMKNTVLNLEVVSHVSVWIRLFCYNFLICVVMFKWNPTRSAQRFEDPQGA